MKKMHHSFFENGASINVNSKTFLTCNIIYNKIRIYDLPVVIINIIYNSILFDYVGDNDDVYLFIYVICILIFIFIYLCYVKRNMKGIFRYESIIIEIVVV